MLAKKKVNALAKRLAQLSFDGTTGCIDGELIREIIRIIQEFHENVRSLLLKKYRYFLETEQANQTVRIEYFGQCDIEKIHTHAEQFAKKKLKCEAIEDPKLIAGIRIILGDQIWERSIRCDLDRIARN
ncbi:MAG: F0F1 ATP synthase subunit delta [Puniceicoccales bacterium]|jgi:F0F1-type ATP synthase delta subunit|nr:F0F1 ATP synthase subunit delta [Puniceicoccales bacterium]